MEVLLAVEHIPEEALSMLALGELHDGIIALPPGEGHGFIAEFFLPDAEEDVFPPAAADIDGGLGFDFVVGLGVHPGQFGVVHIAVHCLIVAHS